VASCPTGALRFGRRAELLEEARRRIYSEPDRYIHQIYGEHEAGGTSWLYLSPVPFEDLHFATHLGTTAYPTYTREFLYAVPLVLTVVPPLLLGMAKARREATGEEGEEVLAGWRERR
jgi:hypothetical protein